MAGSKAISVWLFVVLTFTIFFLWETFLKSSFKMKPMKPKWRLIEGKSEWKTSQTSHEQINFIESEENENPLEQPKWRPLNESDIHGLQSYLFFIGWARSCHSVIGSMLDAHPNMIIAHEYFLFDKLTEDETLKDRNTLFNELYSKSYRCAVKGARSNKQTIKGYNFHMAGSWQGQYSKLKVIGDKSGRDSVNQFKTTGRAFYLQFKKAVRLPIKVLQVIRNPFDVIATKVLYHDTTHKGKIPATTSNKYTDFVALGQSTRSFLRLTETLMSMVTDLNLSPHLVYCEDLVTDPIKTISEICDYLEVECSAEYLQKCADKTFKKVSKSHDLITWDHKTLPSLIEDLKKYPWFARYL